MIILTNYGAIEFFDQIRYSTCNCFYDLPTRIFGCFGDVRKGSFLLWRTSVASYVLLSGSEVRYVTAAEEKKTDRYSPRPTGDKIAAIKP